MHDETHGLIGEVNIENTAVCFLYTAMYPLHTHKSSPCPCFGLNRTNSRITQGSIVSLVVCRLFLLVSSIWILWSFHAHIGDYVHFKVWGRVRVIFTHSLVMLHV